MPMLTTTTNVHGHYTQDRHMCRPSHRMGGQTSPQEAAVHQLISCTFSATFEIQVVKRANLWAWLVSLILGQWPFAWCGCYGAPVRAIPTSFPKLGSAFSCPSPPIGTSLSQYYVPPCCQCFHLCRSSCPLLLPLALPADDPVYQHVMRNKITVIINIVTSTAHYS